MIVFSPYITGNVATIFSFKKFCNENMSNCMIVFLFIAICIYYHTLSAQALLLFLFLVLLLRFLPELTNSINDRHKACMAPRQVSLKGREPYHFIIRVLIIIFMP